MSANFLSITEPQVKPLPTIGERGERLAVGHLMKNGYRIVVTNFKVPIGRNSKGVAVTGEIDVIALDGETLIFCEVKTRRSEEFTPIITNVDRRKQRQIMRTARVYRRLFGISGIKYRYDVVTVLMPEGGRPRIEQTKDFWSEASFRKMRWREEAWY